MSKLYTFEQDCYLLIIDQLITDPDELLIKVLADIEFEQKHINMFGKLVPLPRLTAFCADTEHEYKYSGIVNSAQIWPPYFNNIAIRLNNLGVQLMPNSKVPNCCFINYYRNGNDYIGWHSDNEMSSYFANPIFSISLGDERTFEIKNKATDQITKVLLKNGSLAVMYGTKFQERYQHKIPKSTSNKLRINLTFRYHSV